tara:strand:+ start:22942 stop:23184 length:243 start_codon:yes stop_codon:yes gene_type:complete
MIGTMWANARFCTKALSANFIYAKLTYGKAMVGRYELSDDGCAQIEDIRVTTSNHEHTQPGMAENAQWYLRGAVLWQQMA